MKRIMTNLRSIKTILNDKILKDLGWDDNPNEPIVESLEEEAIRSYSRTIAKQPAVAWNERLYRGFAYLEQGEPKKALRDFKFLKGSGRGPTIREHPEINFFMGIAHVEIGKFVGAINHFEFYLEDHEISPDVGFWVGLAFYGHNIFKEAIKYLDTAIKDDPSFEEAYLARGKALIKNGDLSKAEHDFSKTLELNPENEDAQYCLRLIQNFQKNISSAVNELD